MAKDLPGILSEAEKERIAAAVRAAEAATSGEIVPMVVARSDSYPGARWRAAVALALLAGLGLHAARPGLPAEAYLWVQFPALSLGYMLASIGALQRFFLTRGEVDDETRDRARREFHAHGLAATRDRTGVLILVSLLEHRVEVLADSGISSKLDPATWERLVASLVARIREGRLADGLCEAVAECGRLMSAHFPRRADDTNEHPDAVVVRE